MDIMGSGDVLANLGTPRIDDDHKLDGPLGERQQHKGRLEGIGTATGDLPGVPALVEAGTGAVGSLLTEHEHGLASLSNARDDVLDSYGNVVGAHDNILERSDKAEGEIANMLGLDGKPYDSSKLTQTPGYQFQLDQGNRALQNSAIGTSLSGDQARKTIEYGQGFAQSYFSKRISDLNILAQLGSFSRGQFTTASTAAGGQLAALGGVRSELHQTQGQDLSDVYTDLGSATANIEIAKITGDSNQAIARANNKSEERRDERNKWWDWLVG